jgi:hypothetical protein
MGWTGRLKWYADGYENRVCLKGPCIFGGLRSRGREGSSVQSCGKGHVKKKPSGGYSKHLLGTWGEQGFITEGGLQVCRAVGKGQGGDGRVEV